VTTRLVDLWYSWANYYVDLNKNVANVSNIAGSIPSGSRTLTVSLSSGRKLVPGMLVTGPGIPAATIITAVSSDNKLVTLSQVATSAGIGTYSFVKPQPIADPKHEAHPFTLSFDPADQTTAAAFAQNAYEVLSVMSTIPPNPAVNDYTLQLLLNVIGCNVGKLPGMDVNLTPVKTEIQSEIRDLTKSLLRGVTDFKTVPESGWYPDPSVKTGGQSFNVFNMNPFVWFVHKKLGLSGYGFSVDDDVSDIGANGATNLQLSIGGAGGLPNTAEWTWGAPYGPVSGTGQITQGVNDRISHVPDDVFFKVNFLNPDQGPGALVTGVGVPAGTRVKAINLADNSFILDHNLEPNTPPGTYTYVFSGQPVNGFGGGNPNQLASAVDQFEQQASAATTIPQLRQLETSYSQNVDSIADAALQNKSLSRAVRKEIRHFEMLTAALTAVLRGSPHHPRKSLAHLKTVVLQYDHAVDKLSGLP
jgi:hypothetical protein